jgi:hypothetical protein
MLVKALLIEVYREEDPAIAGDAVLCTYDQGSFRRALA